MNGQAIMHRLLDATEGHLAGVIVRLEQIVMHSPAPELHLE